jgi:hypothetical protein
MIEQAFSLITLHKYWANYQQRLTATITPLSSEQLALPAASHHWMISELLEHMIGARFWWFHMWMGEGASDLVDWLDDQLDICVAASLVIAFEKTWQMISPAQIRPPVQPMCDTPPSCPRVPAVAQCLPQMMSAGGLKHSLLPHGMPSSRFHRRYADTMVSMTL